MRLNSPPCLSRSRPFLSALRPSADGTGVTDGVPSRPRRPVAAPLRSGAAPRHGDEVGTKSNRASSRWGAMIRRNMVVVWGRGNNHRIAVFVWAVFSLA